MSVSSVLVTPGRGEADRPAADRDDLLQASRRVDWRFLLPDPSLPDVAVWEGSDPLLISSLRRLAGSVKILAGGSSAEYAGRFPVVVAGNPGREGLVQVVQAACCRGYVYVEVDRRRSARLANGERVMAGGINDWLAALTRLHVVGIQVYWHWPDFQSCTEIVPLQDPAAARCVLRRRGSGFRSRCKANLAAVLLNLGWFRSFVPCFSLLGQRFQQEDTSVRPIPFWRG